MIRRLCTQHARAFSLVEAVVAIAIVGGLLVATLNAVSGVVADRQTTSDQARAEWLAQRLMAEILALPYQEPGSTGLQLSFGPTADQSAPGNRSKFNDVGDYTGWTESPPQDKDGTVIPGFIGWTRSVKIEWVNASDDATVSMVDQEVKRITVKVLRGKRTYCTLVGLRTKGWDSAWAFPPGVSTSSVTSGSLATFGSYR